MVAKPFTLTFASILGCSFLLAQADSALVDKTRQATPAPAHTLTEEERGDIMMARKMYREAIEAFQSAPQKSAVIYNKIGIAYHQLQQLDNARKSYEKALKIEFRLLSVPCEYCDGAELWKKIPGPSAIPLREIDKHDITRVETTSNSLSLSLINFSSFLR